LCSSFTASAESINDGTGDVYHWSQSGTAWSWRANVGDKPNIDITEISYSVNDDKLTLKLKVAGNIQNSEHYWYNVYFNSSDTVYMWWWSNGSGFGMASNQGQQAYDMQQNFTVTEDSISVEFNILGDTLKVELWGQAHQYTTIGSSQQTNEWWGDWAPNSKFTGEVIDDDSDTDGTNGDTDGGNGNTSKPSTPGFEVLAVITAIAVALILLRKHR
jgi:hypothetical protein